MTEEQARIIKHWLDYLDIQARMETVKNEVYEHLERFPWHDWSDTANDEFRGAVNAYIMLFGEAAIEPLLPNVADREAQVRDLVYSSYNLTDDERAHMRLMVG